MRNVRGASSGDFNPLPRKEGDNDSRRWGRTILNFNPLPRKEGDVGGNVINLTSSQAS